MNPVSEDAPAPRQIDTTVPHSARIWNYWLGGKDNYAIDRQVGEHVAKLFPSIVDEARISRSFLRRAVRYLAAEAGIRQFLDIGTGLPTADNTHQIAQQVAPECRIVYVDNDPLVLAHARALLTSSPEGTAEYIDADVRAPGAVLAEAAKTLDFTKPIAVIMNGILGHVTDDGEAHSIVARLVDGLPPGSYLTLSDGSDTSEEGVESMKFYNQSGAIPYHLRSPEQIGRFFDGLDLVEPGVVPRNQWRPDITPPSSKAPSAGYAGVARKP
jgi:O-methyltransferase involved in polyketide biosynthesis